MTENQTPGPSGEDEIQRRIDDAMKRAITVNVNQVSAPAPAPVTVERYPGIGAGFHILHLILTLMTGFWIFVWIAHAVIARNNWKHDQEAKREAERQQREGSE